MKRWRCEKCGADLGLWENPNGERWHLVKMDGRSVPCGPVSELIPVIDRVRLALAYMRGWIVGVFGLCPLPSRALRAKRRAERRAMRETL